MTTEGLIPSKQFDVWERLYKRYLLEPMPLEGSRASVGLTIQPVTQADELLRAYRVDQSGSLDLSASAGADVLAFAVPADERWLLTFFQRAATIANSQVTINPGNQLGVSIELTALATAAAYEFAVSMLLPPSTNINMRTTGNAGDSAVNMSVATARETIF